MTIGNSSSDRSTRQPSIRHLVGSTSGVLVALAIHLIFDQDTFARRLHIFYAGYISIFFVLLFLFLLGHIAYARSSNTVSLLRFAVLGLLYGLLAGALAYLLAVQFDMFAIRGERSSFGHNVMDDLVAYASTLFVFPLISLKSWLYGLTAGLVASATLRVQEATP